MSKPVIERFWSKVSKAGPDGCWLWTGAVSSTGYGQFAMGGKKRGAHRVAWLLEHGSWPQPMACHSCDSKACVNPRHLWEGDGEMNLRDAASKGRLQAQRSTLCKHGHPLVAKPSGRRYCPQCVRLRALRVRAGVRAMETRA